MALHQFIQTHRGLCLSGCQLNGPVIPSCDKRIFMASGQSVSDATMTAKLGIRLILPPDGILARDTSISTILVAYSFPPGMS
jgi:hypothetical protein